MSWKSPLGSRWLALVFTVLALAYPATALHAWTMSQWPYYVDPVPFAPDTGVQPAACQVKSIVKIGNGTRPDWSRDGRLIAYDVPMLTAYEVGLMKPDGTQARCLTCGPKLPQVLQGKHKGKATFYPGGWYLLFGAENEYGDHSLATTPGSGDNYDLWVTNLLGSAFWRLTKNPQGSAIQSPRFSRRGDKLLWSERYAAGDPTTLGDELGLWKMKMADFVVTKTGPTLQNIVELTPGGPGFYEPHGFSPDGSTIIFTAMFEPGVSQYYGQIYTYNLVTNALTKLASADNLHFEQAYYSPDGKKISFMSGDFIGLLQGGYATDLYLMDASGANRVRLTFFNDPGLENAGSYAFWDKNAWNPDGSQLVAGTYISATNDLVVHLISFEGQCGGSLVFGVASTEAAPF